MSGQLILIKHVLQSIPLCFLAALDPSKQVIKDIEKLFSKFLWGTHEELDKCQWMSCPRHGICLPTASYGLRIFLL